MSSARRSFRNKFKKAFISCQNDRAQTAQKEEAMEEHEQELPQNVADLAQASVPSAIRGIRACKRCGILKTLDQFVDDGCEASPSRW